MTKFYLLVKRFLPVLVLASCCSVALAQSRTVSGKVTSADDALSIPGANILEKGTVNGTVTDADGNFKISVGDNATLVFTFVGFATQEIVVGSQSVVSVTLKSDVTSLSEVVVTGYGTQEKKELTSAITSVKSADFNKGTVNDPMQLLQGKVAGLAIARPGGDPNGKSTIRLRGIATFGANSEPLIVIDGVIGGSLSTVDPNDIASMDVLKDASAAAIYGSRGGSGVIIITTKTGKVGKMQVSYNGSTNTESIARSIPVMDAATYRKVPGAVDLGASTDWLKTVTQTSHSQVHNLSVSAGNASTQYRASINYRNANGIAINSGFQQLNARLNLTQKALRDRLTFTLNLSSSSKDAKYGFKESFRYAVLSNPTLPVYDNTLTSPTAGGLFGGYAERAIFDYFNPLSIAQQGKADGTDSRLLVSLNTEYDFSDFVPGLRASAFYSSQRESDFRAEYYNKTAKFRGYGRNGLATQQTDRRNTELFESVVNYQRNISSVDLAVVGGYSYQTFFNTGNGMQGGNFLTDAFTYNNMGASLDIANGLGAVGSYANSNKLVAFFGRANINVSNNYFFSLSGRYEGSSRFGANNKWGFFPAASAGVTLSNLVDIPGVNNLKLRVSYGVTGNQPADSYASLQRFGRTGNFFYQGKYGPSYGPISNANPNLKWETKSEIDFGMDFAMLSSKLTGTFDIYQRTTKDLLLNVNVPVPPNLYNQTLVNIGELQNQGIELALNYAAISTAKMTWTTGINFATYSTKVVSLSSGGLSAAGEGGVLYRANMGSPGQNATSLVRVKEGENLGQLWGPVQESINTDGTPKFKDLDGNGSYCNCDLDRKVVGNGLPTVTIGWNNTFNFGQFDFNFFLRSAIGHDLYNSYRGFYENLEPTTINNYNVVNTKYFDPKITKAVVNNTHVEKATFLRLDNASLGYNLKIGSGKAISSLRFYVSGQNLFTITGYTGVDPEVRYTDVADSDNGFRPGAEDPLAPGVERRSTYFTTRIYTIGVNLGF